MLQVEIIRHSKLNHSNYFFVRREAGLSANGDPLRRSFCHYIFFLNKRAAKLCIALSQFDVYWARC